jgi:hypothetical protein
MPTSGRLANDARSGWISDNTAAQPGSHVYLTQFDLTGFNPDTAVVQFRIATHDYADRITLNSSDTGLRLPHQAAESAFTGTFTLSRGFQQGINTLRVDVNNVLGNAGLRLVIDSAIACAATITITPSSGFVGTPISVTGSGYTPSEPITITGPGAITMTTTTADSSGNFTASTRIFPAPFGNFAIQATGGTSGITNSSNFSVVARILLKPNSGSIGSTIQIEGFGFGAKEQVKVYWDSPRTSLTTLQTNAKGTSAILTFTIPSGVSTGSNSVVAKGQTSGATARSLITVQ